MNTDLLKPRVRFAPSPTGFLHVGGLRTALYNYLFAHQQGGTYILRIEDTDQTRLVPGAKESLVLNLCEMGFNADEGVRLESGAVLTVGDNGPYEQSKRLKIYQKYADTLVASGYAYHCFCTSERLATLREEQRQKKIAPRYDKHCLGLEADVVAERLSGGEPHVVRLNVMVGQEVSFEDMVRGTVQFHTKDIDDQVLLKSDGFPTYHLANVVDDHLMDISHVIRGEEWLSSTPKHVLLYKAFGWEAPLFAHLPLLLNPDKSKLSKRQGDVAVEDYIKKGYLPEALINFVALLGWNPGGGSTQEIFSLAELTEVFDITHIHKGGAVFDHQKLDWMNGEYIKKLDPSNLYTRMVAGEFFDRDFIKASPVWAQTEEYLKKVLAIEQERLVTLTDFGKENPFFFVEEANLDPSLLPWKDNSSEQTSLALTTAVAILTDTPVTLWESREALQEFLLTAAGDQRGDFLWPLRVALTGAQKSPSPSDVAWVLGKENTILRLNKALKCL